MEALTSYGRLVDAGAGVADGLARSGNPIMERLFGPVIDPGVKTTHDQDPQLPLLACADCGASMQER
jgi:hypothetical protein